MNLTFNLAPSYRDLKDPTSRQNFADTVEHKCVIDLRACLMIFSKKVDILWLVLLFYKGENWTKLLAIADNCWKLYWCDSDYRWILGVGGGDLGAGHWGGSWHTGMSYLISLNSKLFKNIAHVRFFHFHFPFRIWKIWKSGFLGM